MKILHVINSLATGGAEKLLLETISLYKERNVNVDLLVLDGKEHPYMEELKKLNCCSIFSLGKGSLYNPIKIFKIIPFLHQYNVIHVHLFPAQYFVVFAKIFGFSKSKLVFTEHNTSNRRIQNTKYKYLERFIYSFYDKIICITKEVKNVFLDYIQLDENKFQVIENGVNLKQVYEAQALEKKHIHSAIEEKDKLIIQIAGFRVQKDQKTVIRAMQYLDTEVKLLLAGDGVLMNECKELVRELHLENRVLFLGVRTDAAPLLKTADISVVSSHWEGFGLAAVEAMAAGTPLIASNVEGLANVVEGGGILFEKGNEKELAGRIEELLHNSSYYNKLVDSGLKRCRQYDINIMVDKHIAMYRDVTSNYN